MKVLRSSLYPPDGRTPITEVLRDSDLNCSIAEAAEGMKIVPGWFVVSEVFDMKDADIATASLAAHKRQIAASKDEQNMAIGYYWWAMTCDRTNDHGIVAGTARSPLSKEQIANVFSQVAKHPAYKSQTVLAYDKAGTPVRLSAGEVSFGIEGSMKDLPEVGK